MFELLKRILTSQTLIEGVHSGMGCYLAYSIIIKKKPFQIWKEEGVITDFFDAVEA